LCFSARFVDKNIEINWQTGSELNNLGFELHKKLDLLVGKKYHLFLVMAQQRK
jgi:hypothetical protein